AQARVGERLPFTLVIRHQRGRRGLAATQDRGDQLIAERAGKGKFNDRQVFQRHDGQPNEIPERAAVTLPGAASGAGRGCLPVRGMFGRCSPERRSSASSQCATSSRRGAFTSGFSGFASPSTPRSLWSWT